MDIPISGTCSEHCPPDSGPCGHPPRLGEGKQAKTHGKKATLNSSGAFAYPPPPCSQVNCSPVTSSHISRVYHIHPVGRWAQQQVLSDPLCTQDAWSTCLKRYVTYHWLVNKKSWTKNKAKKRLLLLKADLEQRWGCPGLLGSTAASSRFLANFVPIQH